MNRNRARAAFHGICASLLALILLISNSNAANAAVVYDSLSGTLYSGGWGLGLQTGQQITLDGTDRAITQLEVLLSSYQHEPFTLRIFEVDGPGGAPGTQIWESPVQTFPAAPGHYINLIVPISVPNIAVPDTFVWTIAPVNDPLTAPLILRNADLPTTGSNGRIWQQDLFTGTWSPASIPTFGLGARVTAMPVPEPGTLALLVLGTIPLAVYRIGRRRAADA